MKIFFLLLLLGVGLLQIGCVGTYSRLNRYGVKAQLIDADSREPLRKTTVQLVLDGHIKRSKTDVDGGIFVKPDYSTHLTWLGGPVLVPASSAVLQITVKGYQSISKQMRDGHAFWHSEAALSYPLTSTEADCFVLGVIRMNKDDKASGNGKFNGEK